MIYLDNSATTKPHPDVLHSFQQVSTSFYANPSSIHPLGGEAEQLLLTAKKTSSKNITCFTRGDYIYSKWNRRK